MLMEEKVKESAYFQGKENIFDQLTKTLTKEAILDYANYLISNNTPFVFGILDIDNFKTVNDNYGHYVGDVVLENVAKNIMDALDDSAYFGRFGGDEFIFIFEGYSKYDEAWRLIKTVFVEGTRNPIKVDKLLTVGITCTAGAACYPTDAKTFDTVFEMADKCLYRGKEKGRNCFIIYVEEKHKNIVIRRNGRGSMLERLNNLYNIYQKDGTLASMEYLVNLFNLSGITIWNSSGIISSVAKKEVKVFPSEYLHLADNGYYKVSDYKTVHKYNEDLYFKLKDYKLLSIIIYKINDCYMMCYDTSFERIWQDYEESLIFVFAKMLENNKL